MTRVWAECVIVVFAMVLSIQEVTKAEDSNFKRGISAGTHDGRSLATKFNKDLPADEKTYSLKATVTANGRLVENETGVKPLNGETSWGGKAVANRTVTFDGIFAAKVLDIGGYFSRFYGKIIPGASSGYGPQAPSDLTWSFYSVLNGSKHLKLSPDVTYANTEDEMTNQTMTVSWLGGSAPGEVTIATENSKFGYALPNTVNTFPSEVFVKKEAGYVEFANPADKYEEAVLTASGGGEEAQASVRVLNAPPSVTFVPDNPVTRWTIQDKLPIHASVEAQFSDPEGQQKFPIRKRRYTHLVAGWKLKGVIDDTDKGARFIFIREKLGNDFGAGEHMVAIVYATVKDLAENWSPETRRTVMIEVY